MQERCNHSYSRFCNYSVLAVAHLTLVVFAWAYRMGFFLGLFYYYSYLQPWDWDWDLDAMGITLTGKYVRIVLLLY